MYESTNHGGLKRNTPQLAARGCAAAVSLLPFRIIVCISNPNDAIDSLAYLGDASAVPHLLSLLKDSDYYVRGKAAEVLGKILLVVKETTEVQRIAKGLWWRLTDTNFVARTAHEALKIAANRLTVLEVKDLKMTDPLCPSDANENEGILGNIRKISKQLNEPILGLISIMIVTIITKFVTDHLGKTIDWMLLIIAALGFMAIWYLKGYLEKPSHDSND